ncbi:uncharacterized protein M6B38_304355 [Iris pallida]|uniref:Uncharacterized protein n=1 Tax=Iris pallida TaxID=29817 RepID=A0AAX6HM50_IRIPA|nr:uncharacterized protein M6B38_304355 [Iris pallida]
MAMPGFSNSVSGEDGAIDRGLAKDGAPVKESTEFVTVDVGSLSALAGREANSSPRVIKSISRKESQRSTEKKAAAEEDATAAYALSVGAHASGKIAVAGHVAVIEEAVPPFATSTTPTASAKLRRLGSGGRRPSPWLHPRKDLLFFATVSSIGTMILLYFTLSTGKMTGARDDVEGRVISHLL